MTHKAKRPDWTEERIAAIVPTKNKKAHAIALGLFIMVNPGGSRHWCHRVYVGTAQPRYPKLGDFPAMTLMAALDELRRAQQAVQTQAAAAPETGAATLADLKQEFIVKDINRRPIEEERKLRYTRTLDAHWLKRAVADVQPATEWGALRLADTFGSHSPKIRTAWITRYQDHLLALQDQQARGSDRRSKSTLGAELNQFAQALFTFGAERGYLTRDGIPPMDRRKLNKSRKNNRHLSVSEIEQLFAATTEQAVLDSPAMTELDACFLRLTLISSARCEAMTIAKRAALHHDMRGWWTFPNEDLKASPAQKDNPFDHLVPITPLLAEEIARLQRHLDREGIPSAYWFPEHRAANVHARGETIGPRSDSWSGRLCSEFKHALGNAGANPYTTHALRRTVSHVMQLLGVEKEVREKASGRVAQGLDGTYASGRMIDYVMIAFEKYHAFLFACMRGKGNEYLAAISDANMARARREEAERLTALGITPLRAVGGGA